MVANAEPLHDELQRACDDSGIAEGLLVAWIVEKERPPDASPIVYLHPAAQVTDETAAVLRAVGSVRAHEYHLRAHRIAVWKDFPGVPEAALAPMVRHELGHAARWQRSGTAFFEADEELRALARGDQVAYSALATEREANAASAAYAEHVLSRLEIDAIRAVNDYTDLVAEAVVPDDIVAATLDELAGRADWRREWGVDQKGAYIARARESAAAWPASGAGLNRERDEPLIEVVAPVANVHAEPKPRQLRGARQSRASRRR